MEIDVHFLGTPSISIDGGKVHIPQRKLTALFLYLLFNLRCTRDELAALFWCDFSEDSARQNLRNGLYKLKNLMGDDVIVTRGNSIVEINPALVIRRDTDILVAEDTVDRLLTLPSFIFLDRLYLKNAEEYDKWVVSIRAIYEKMAQDRLEKGMRESMHTGEHPPEEYAGRLLAIAPYHEEACRVLMQQYGNRGMTAEAIRVYTGFARRLESELNLEPEAETRELYRLMLELRASHGKERRSWVVYPAHERAVLAMTREYEAFRAGRECRHCIFLGDMGMGKSRVIHGFLETEETPELIQMKFETTSADIPYYAIGKIIDLLAERFAVRLSGPVYHDPDSLKLYNIIAMDAISGALKARKVKLLLVLENIESIDGRSMDLVFSHLLDKCRGEVLVIGEYCRSYCLNHIVPIRLGLLQNVCVQEMEALTEQETMAYFSGKLTESGDGVDLLEIHRRTSGILMLLEDVLQNIRAGRSEVYGVRDSTLVKLAELFASLSTEEYECLELLTLFRNGIELETLAAITGRSSLGLIDAVDRLHQRRLVLEEDFEGHLVVRLRTAMIRDVIYGQISRLRRVELHRLIARHYETLCPRDCRDYFYLAELKFHFDRAGCRYERIYYAMRELWHRLDYCDEFFPTIKSGQELLNTFYISKGETYAEFAAYARELAALGDTLPAEQNEELTLMYDYLMGRTLIRDSRGAEGIVYIHRMVALAERLDRDDLLLKGYMEMVYYGIKTENEALMRENIRNARRIRQFSRYETENGVLLRHEALCDIMSGDYGHAEALLFQSIELLESPRLKNYSYIHVAAAYDYLGLIYRRQGDYERSAQWLGKAIRLCLEKNVKKSLELFYEDLGYTQFLAEDYEGAKANFAQSAEIYSMFDTYWLRSIGESCMAVIAAGEGRQADALQYFRRAEIYSRKDHTREELAVLETSRQALQQMGIL